MLFAKEGSVHMEDRLTSDASATEINSKSWQGLSAHTQKGSRLYLLWLYSKLTKDKVCLFNS